jgi:hypothetical protein
MTHLWKVQDFESELQHLEKLAALRPNSPVLRAMQGAFVAKLQGVQDWSSESIVKLLDQADKLRVDASIKDRIVECIEKLSSASGAGAYRLTQGGQKVPSLSVYLTKADWGKLQEHHLVQDQLRLLAKRLNAMGVTSLKENTKVQAVAIVCHLQHALGHPAMSPHMLHSLRGDFEAIFKAEPPAPTPGCAAYPLDPRSLGEDWLRKAYGDESPECRDVPLAAFLRKAHSRACPWMSRAWLMRQDM